MMSSSKTYCIFSANYLPNVGGVEKYTQNLAFALADGGDRAIIVTSNVFGLPAWETLRDGVEIVRLPCWKILGGRLPISRRIAVYRALYSRLASERIDYVVVNTRFYRHSFEGVRLAEVKGIRPIVIDHGSAHLTLGNKILDVAVAQYEHAVTRSLKRHDADYYAVSGASCRWLEHFGIASKGVLNNSIDAEAFRRSSSGRDFRSELGLGSDRFVVSFAGRFIPEKGIVPLMDAAEQLSGEPDVAFLLAGDGPLKREVEGRGLPNVVMLGRLDAPDIVALLQSSDAFCLPSRSEGFSTSLLECAACGVPPIVTHVGGVDELMPDEGYGCLLSEATAEEIVKWVRILKGDPRRCRAIGEKLRGYVEEEFSWPRTASKVREACAAANSSRTSD